MSILIIFESVGVLFEGAFSLSILNITFTLRINQLLQLNTFSFIFFLRLFYLSTKLFCLLTCLSLAQSWIFGVTFQLVSKFQLFVLFRALWLLVTMNKLNHKAYHGSHASHITPLKILLRQTIFGCVQWNKTGLVTRIFGNRL